MVLKIVQVGDPVLRAAAREVTAEEIRSSRIQALIEWMRETMYDAPGVGLACPQVGISLQIAVIEDKAELLKSMPAAYLEERRRRPVPFQVLINPRIQTGGETVEFYEGCLSFEGYGALVPRALEVQVDCLNHRGKEVSFQAEGWHARIVQHEVDHLNGGVYVDRMLTRSLSTNAHLNRHWGDLPIAEVKKRLAL
ncbi:MAG TPA: peptide deformylase [Candidatus Sulfopaludibacter sp.]|nr:peptide deformylase [Candidatus Sulfopaludibacter sp.]